VTDDEALVLYTGVSVPCGSGSEPERVRTQVTANMEAATAADIVARYLGRRGLLSGLPVDQLSQYWACRPVR
jgi:hypothetical protein